MTRPGFLLAFSLLLLAAERCSALRIGAFNIQIFGRTKFSNEEVVSTLTQIVQRYDMLLIQEIRDSSETVIYSFLERVNSDRNGEAEYALNVSIRLGRTSSKEQYAFMYRTDRVEVLREFQFDDSANDMFEREPYSVLVRITEEGRELPDFFLVGIHTSPGDAVAEIEALHNVYEEAAEFYGNENGIILGDFNADCSYLSLTRYNTLLLVVDERFTWLIDNSVDTTTGNSNCTYDRIVVAGNITDYVVPASASVFRFDLQYDLSLDQTTAVSDHYPVEVQLQGAETPTNEIPVGTGEVNTTTPDTPTQQVNSSGLGGGSGEQNATSSETTVPTQVTTGTTSTDSGSTPSDPQQPTSSASCLSSLFSLVVSMTTVAVATASRS